MGVVMLVVRNGARRRAAELTGLAVVVALGAGAAMASLSLAWRTDHAYPDHLRRAAVGELVVNPSLVTDRVREVVESTPGVVDVVSDALFLATPDTGESRARLALESNPVQVRSSPDGRYVRRDRPAVHAGRTLSGPGEAFLNREAAAALGVGVGDEIPIAFWQNSPRGEGAADLAELVEPLGKATARVVGIGVFADEVLPDEVYPRSRVVLSPDLTAPFDCTTDHPPADDTLTLDRLTVAFFPEGCSRDPQFFSLRLAGGHATAAAVAARIAERLDELNQSLPKVMQDLDLGFSVIPTITGEEQARVRRSLSPSVTALQLFGLMAGISTLTIAGLAAIRSGRRLGPEAAVWSELGMTRRQRAAAAGIPLGAAGVVGLAGASVVAWLASGAGPVASARAVEPDAVRSIPLPVAATVILVGLLVLGLEIWGASWLASTRQRERAAPRQSRVARSSLRLGGVPLAVGVRAALPGAAGTGAGAGALLLGAVAVVLAVVGSIVFSANVDRLVGTPARFGWPFDAAAVIGYGYGGADEEALARSLDRDDVVRWGLAALPGEVTVKGESLPAIADKRGFDAFAIPVVAGRLPTGDGEIALGARSAERLGLGIGDRVPVGTTYGDGDAEVTGLVVLPSIGPYQSDRAGLGTGALLSRPFLDRLVGDAEGSAGVPPGTLAETLGTFLVLDVADGTGAGTLLAELAGESATWDVNGFPVFDLAGAVRPPEIADVAAMRSAPALLAALLAASMAVALALAIALATRARRRQLAILRALGATPGQIRSTVRWHAVTVVAVGLMGGVVLGISLGSMTWRAFSDGLGVVPSVAVPWRWIVGGSVVAVLVALAAAEPPARLAPRRAAAHPLRRE